MLDHHDMIKTIMLLLPILMLELVPIAIVIEICIIAFVSHVIPLCETA